jgi:hypothetical protein
MSQSYGCVSKVVTAHNMAAYEEVESVAPLILSLGIIYSQGRPLPMGQPGQSEKLGDPPPQYIKICHTPDHDMLTTLRRQS